MWQHSFKKYKEKICTKRHHMSLLKIEFDYEGFEILEFRGKVAHKGYSVL